VRFWLAASPTLSSIPLSHVETGQPATDRVTVCLSARQGSGQDRSVDVPSVADKRAPQSASIKEIRVNGVGVDEAHLAPQDVDQLRQIDQAGVV
jgi:hypothetical protein